MKKLARILGTIAFWVGWPVSYIYLRRSERVRVLLVTNDEKILLVQTWHGTGEWSLPGGGTRKNEDKTRAAQRELMEETTIALGAEQLQPLGLKKHTEYGLVFTCDYFGAKLTAPIAAKPRLPEILEARWVAKSDLPQYRLGPDVRHALSVYPSLLQ